MSESDKDDYVYETRINTKDIKKIIPEDDCTEVWALNPEKFNDLHCYKVPNVVSTYSDIISAYTAASVNPVVDIYV